MQVARTKVLLGVKDRSVPADTEARLRRQLVTRVLLERLFAGSSEVREDLHRRGVVDDSLSTGYHGERTFGFTVVGCETDQDGRQVIPAEFRGTLAEARQGRDGNLGHAEVEA